MMTLIKDKLVQQLLAIYILVRIFSFVVYAYNFNFLNAVISLGVILLFTYITIKKPDYGFFILASELILGGAGNFLSFDGLIIRSWFLVIFAIIWLYKKRKKLFVFDKFIIKNKIIFGLVLATIIFATVNGFYQGHAVKMVLQDAVLYLFLLLIIPLIEYKTIIKKYGEKLISSFIYISAIMAYLSFAIYSFGLGKLPDMFYHWFRNIAGGKITDLGNNFYRIVSSEQLLLIPIILILFSYLLHKKSKKLWILFLLSISIIILNFTRIYFLAIIIGCVVLLFNKHKINYKRWLFVSSIAGLFAITFLMTTSLIVSKGKTAGLELVGVKISGLSRQNTDVSGATRMIILPEVIKKFKEKPLLGSGFATEITFFDIAINKKVTRTQFDWGYFEMLVELGLIGFIIYMSFIIYIIKNLFYLGFIDSSNKNRELVRGVFAGLMALLIVNITTPALFQGFGVVYIVYSIFIIKEYKYKKVDY